MSTETPLTPDPALDKLARFSPAPTAIDRDELLFQAGRASARAGNGWKALVALLLVTQAATLGMWLTNSGRSTPVPGSEVVVRPPTSSEAPDSGGLTLAPPLGRSPEPLDRSSYAALLRWDIDTMPTPPPAVSSGQDGPVLSVADRHLSRFLD
jgi:hypothetical protein